jgi:hypothetical protein
VCTRPYVYTDAKYDGSSDDQTYLKSGLIMPSRDQCLTFWYHMFGYYICGNYRNKKPTTEKIAFELT